MEIVDMSKNTFRLGTRPSFNEHMYLAELVLSVEAHRGKLSIIKNRNGEKGIDLSLKDTIDILSYILCKVKYRGRMELFQSGMQKTLVDQIEKTLNMEGGES